MQTTLLQAKGEHSLWSFGIMTLHDGKLPFPAPVSRNRPCSSSPSLLLHSGHATAVPIQHCRKPQRAAEQESLARTHAAPEPVTRFTIQHLLEEPGSSCTDVQTAPCPRGLRRSLRVTPAQLPERVQPEPLPKTSSRVFRCQPVPSRKTPQASLQEETRLSDENSNVVMGDISF